MGSLSDYAEQVLLGHLLNSAYSQVATVYLGLSTADPTDAATGASCSEVANANGYTRKAITFAAASGRAIAQTGAVTFDAVTGAGYSASYWFIADSGTWGAGNVLATGALSAGRTFVAGNIPSVASGQVTITFSAGAISSVVARKLLDKMFRNQTYAKPDTFAAVCTVAVADGDTSITEPAGGSYARVQINPNGGSSPTWTTVAAGGTTTASNNEQVDFGIPASSPTITAMAVMSASSGGDILFYDNSIPDQVVAPGDTMYFAVNQLAVSMA